MIGVQRQVVAYTENVSSGAVFAQLDCRHEVKLDVGPSYIPPSRPRGRYIDCPTCTKERDSK